MLPPARAWLLALTASGCLRLNPEFDTDGAATIATSTGTTTTTSTTTSSSDTGSTGPTPTTTGADPSSSGGAPPPTDCWHRAPDDWDLRVELTAAELGQAPRSGRISPDGLVLYYMAGDPARPYRAKRGSLDVGFDPGVELVAWPAVTLGMDYPNVLADETELILAGRDTDDDLLLATNLGNGWTDPLALADPLINTTFDDSLPTLTADGARMIFQRNDGPVHPFLQGTTSRFFEAARPPGSPPGTAFGAPSLVTIAGYTDDPDYPHINLCATLSPDGLRLFFASTYPKVLDDSNKTDSLTIRYTERAALDAPWAAPVELASHSESGHETCPTSVTADGCTLIFDRFTFMIDPADYRLYIATRSPV